MFWIKPLGRFPMIVMFLASLVGVACRSDAPAQMQSAAVPNAAPQKLSADGEATLRGIVDTAKDPDLRWPDFPPYQNEVKKLYEGLGYTLVWIRGGQPTPQALAVINLIKDADTKGIVADDYGGPRWDGRVEKLRQSPSDSDLARFDVALTVSAMRYIRAVHVGRVNPQLLGLQLDVQSRKHDLSEFLKASVIDAPDPAAAINAVEPTFPGYLRTLDALRIYKEKARQDNGEQLPSVAKPLSSGQNYPGVPRLAKLLTLLGDLPSDAAIPPDSTVYDGTLVDAVKSYQGRHGLDPNGRLDAKTIQELNTPLNTRVRQIELTIERWRWVPHSFSSPPVVVNLPEFRLRTMDEQGKVNFYKTVIVGKAYGHKSPVFIKEMKYVVFRPYWEVTPTIQRAEIVPRIEKDRNYIASKNFEVVSQDGQVVTDGQITDEVLAQLKAGRLRVRQKPGPTNSLGLVKLIFPNPDNVYLHGTDAPGLFSQFRRDFSHGCIRVQNPGELAAWALRNNPGWNADRVQATMNGTENNVQVNLAQSIPVLIIYGTVAVDEEDLTHFFDDIYGYDADLEKALAKGYPYP